MGSETNCTMERGGRKTSGKALLESDHIVFRGTSIRTRLLLADLAKVEVHGDALILDHPDGEAVPYLAAGMALKWWAKIKNPRSLLDKMGVKEGMHVVVIGVRDADFQQQLTERVGRFGTRARAATDVVVLGAETPDDLGRLAALRATLVRTGAIWVVHRKGVAATLRDVDLFAAGRRAGLVDNKVVAFSPTHTASRLVIPLSQR